MKKMTLFLAAFFLSSLVFAQTKFEISGTYKTPINGFMRVVYQDNNVDSIPIQNGKFKYTGLAQTPILVTLFPRLQNIPSDLKIAGVGMYVGEKATILSLDTMTSKNSRFTAVITKLNYLQKSIFQEKLDELSGELHNLDPSKELDKKSGGEILISAIENVNSEVEKSIMVERFSRYLQESKLKALYDGFSEQTKSSITGVRIKNALVPKYTLKIGDVLPQFSQKDVKGNLFNIADLKGRYVLIDFWASWCVPCREENPNLVKAYQKFKGKKLEILGVSLDLKKDAWIDAIAKDNLSWKQVSDLNGWENEVSRMFNVRSVPANILIDKQGKIIALNLRGEELEKKLSEVLL